MHIELIDALRCRVPHEDSWLVGRFDRIEERDILEGTLGCPVCRAEYPIRMGAVHFDFTEPAVRGRTVGSAEREASDPEAALRLAAMLGLSDSGGLALLAGRWASLAPQLEALVDVRFLLLNPAGETVPGDSVLLCGDQIPVARGALRAVALDAASANQTLRDSAALALRPGGRLLLPASAGTIPAGLAEIARDAEQIVAESRGGSPLIPIRRR